ncbi:MAG: methyltransferase domain-containing protein [Candidatus Binataceae bacterium]
MALAKDIDRLRRMGIYSYARYRRRRISNRFLRVANLVGPRSYECPCCGWSGAHFLNHVRETYWMRGAVCPRCRSHPRHRGLTLHLRRVLPALRPGAAILHFAPERSLAPVFRSFPRLHYVAADLGPRAISVSADTTAIPFRGGTFDLVLSSHVIEHVENDRAALAEIARVTAPGGQAMIMAPMLPEWASQETVDFGFPNPAEDGHYRIYGRDFSSRIAAAGLRCEVTTFAALIATERRVRCGVADGPIFIGRKPV